jgi:hypothetical protein
MVQSSAAMCTNDQTMHVCSLHESVAYSLPHVAIVAWLSKITVQVDAVYDWQPLLEQKPLQFAAKHKSDRNSATPAEERSQTPSRHTADTGHSISHVTPSLT